MGERDPSRNRGQHTSRGRGKHGREWDADRDGEESGQQADASGNHPRATRWTPDADGEVVPDGEVDVPRYAGRTARPEDRGEELRQRCLGDDPRRDGKEAESAEPGGHAAGDLVIIHEVRGLDPREMLVPFAAARADALRD